MVSAKEMLILELLKKSPRNIEDVSGSMGINRITASKYLAVLEAKGFVTHAEEGRAKIYSVVKK